MSFYNFTKTGTIFASYKAYFPSLIDTSDLSGWPWTVTCFSSTDHESSGNGIYMCGAVGDPTVLANWETYNTALARGAFAAFGTKPAANPIYIDADLADSETPSVVRIGSQFYLTSHGTDGTHGQTTRLAIASDYPLNFTRLASNSGRVIDGSVTPLSLYPHYSAHTGYFRWGENNLPGVPYDYLGFGLFGGGDKPNHAMYGSNDGQAWTLLSIRHESINIPGAASDRIFSWNEAEPKSIRSIGNGEHVMLVALTTKASGSTTRYSDCYEVTLSGDGLKMTRNAVAVISRGSTGANDQDEVGQPSVLEYGGNILCVYQGSKASVNSLMLAVGSFNASASKATPIAERNFTRQRYDATGSTALPSWLSAVGTTPTPTATGLTINGAGGIRLSDALVPDTCGWMEAYVEQSGSGSTTPPILHIGDSAGPTDPNNGVMAVSYSGIDDTQIRVRAGAANAATANALYTWHQNSPNKSKTGLRWDAAADSLKLLGYNRELIKTLDASGADSSLSVRPGFYVNTGGTIQISAFEVRISAASGGVDPVIASGACTETTLVLTLDKPCLGDGTGLTVTANGSAVSGTWTRSNLTTLTFTRSSGAFAQTDAVVVGVSSTDIRSTADLVAIQDTTYSGTAWDDGIPDVPMLHMAVYPASADAPTWGRMTGWSGSPVYSDSESSPTASGANSHTFTPDSSGLSEGTDYVWYVVWDDGTTTVGPVASEAFTTLRAVSPLTASGTTTASGSATLEAQVALAAVGVALAGGSATAGVSVPLSAAGISVAGGSANGTATVTLTASGLAQAAGSAGLSASVLLAAAGAAQASGNATLAAQLNALAAGAAQAGGSANLSGGAPGALSAAGAAQASGQAVLSVTVQLAATGGAQASGSATGNASAPGQIAASGSAQAAGTATVNVTVQLTAAGFVQAMGAGQFSAQIPLQAVGQAMASGSAALAISNGSTLAPGPERYRLRAPARLARVVASRNYTVKK